MLRAIEVGNTMAFSFPVDPTAVFEAGAIGQLYIRGNEVLLGLSDGTAPIGILADHKATSFSKPQVDEVVIINTGLGAFDGYGNTISLQDSKQELQFPNIVRSSFISTIPGLILNDINGVITAPAGSALNFDADGDGIPDSLRTIVTYTYRIPNIPGADTTLGSKRAAIWWSRGFYETDQYDTTRSYPLNALLFVNKQGLLTSQPESERSPGIGMVTGPPTALITSLEFLWL